MKLEMTPYVRAGRVIRLMGWLSLVAVLGIFVSIIIPEVVQHKTPPVAIFIVLIVLIIPIFQLILAKAVMEHRKWARTAGIIYGIICLFGFPVGTLIGAFILGGLGKGWDDTADSSPSKPEKH